MKIKNIIQKLYYDRTDVSEGTDVRPRVVDLLFIVLFYAKAKTSMRYALIICLFFEIC